MKTKILALAITTILAGCGGGNNEKKQAGNNAPVIEQLPNFGVMVGTGSIYEFIIKATDQDGDSLEFSLEGNPEWVLINPETGVITINSLHAVDGIHSFYLVVSDGTNEVRKLIRLKVEPYTPDLNNQTPEFQGLAESYSLVEFVEFVEFKLQVVAVDEEENELTYQLRNNPPWVSINHETGLLTAKAPDNSVGAHELSILVSDGNTMTTQNVTLNVALGDDPEGEIPDIENTAPSVDIIPTMSVVINKTAVHRVLASDKDGDILSYSLDANEDWISIDEKGLIVASPKAEHEGNYNFVVTVTDGKVDVAKGFGVKVGIDMTPILPPTPPTPPTVFDIPDIKLKEGETETYRVRAIDENNDPLVYTLVGAPEWVSIDSNGIISVNSPSGSKGSYTFTVGVSDGTTNVTKTATVVVSSAIVYDVSTNVSLGGSVAPRYKEVSEGEATKFVITPNEDFYIDSVTGCNGSLSDNEFTTGQVTSACEVSVNFISKAIRAINEQDHTLATDKQLIDFISTELDKNSQSQKALIDELYAGTDLVTWNLNKDAVVFKVSAAAEITPVLFPDEENYSGSDAHIFAGQRDNGAKYAAYGLVPFHNAAGDFDKLTQNTMSWLVGKDITAMERPLKIVTAQLENTYYYNIHNDIKEWHGYGEQGITINDYGVCDGRLAECVAEYEPDLVIVGDYTPLDGGKYNDARKAELDYVAQSGTSLMVIARGENGGLVEGLMTYDMMYDQFGVTTGSFGYWHPHPVENVSAETAKGFIDLRQEAPQNVMTRLMNETFDSSMVNGCDRNYGYCETSEFANHFKYGAEFFLERAKFFDSRGEDMFDVEGYDIIKAGLLLGDKYRSEIDYPISKDDTQSFYEALFGDFAIHYARKGNLAQPDLGEYIVDTSLVVEGEAANYETPAKITDEKLITVPFRNQWTTTGWYAPKGETVKLTRMDNTNHKVTVRLYYARHNTNRNWEQGKMYKHSLMTTEHLVIPVGGSVSFSTPYGAPIYLYIDGDSVEGTDAVSARIKAEGIVKHATITDFSSAEQIATFIETLETTDLPHVDLRSPSYELHLRRDRFENAYGDNSEAYPTINALLDGVKNLHINDNYSLAGLKVDGLDLVESVPASAMSACSNQLGEADCTDETLHRRGIIQHANYDQHAQCGVGCGGSPWDSSYTLSPEGWLDNHELGHNLQTGRLQASYVAEGENNEWGKYHNRAGEASNNIFPFVTLWKHARVHLERTDVITDPHMNQRHMFFAFMSDALDLMDGNGERISYNANCDSEGSADRFESIWSSGEYAIKNGQRMTFYIQMALRMHGETLADGTVMSNGFDIYPLLYLHERIFGKYAATQELWDANRERLGFGMFDFNNDTLGEIKHISGNDFMLVSLSYMTGKNWSLYFDMMGLRYSDKAAAQALAHGTVGGEVTNVPVGMYSFDEDIPMLDLHEGAVWVDLSNPTAETVWGRDNATPLNCQ
ncbi:Peptidase M60-like family [Vibrio sp. B1REV9]|uniref:ImpA family metalloprotease n=1 Tax=Vibrio sp. B1REV9 TaxID=2751179 RepID=UPI001B00FA8B|nr:ImpA family metalloprotease [Vibrio sp. B1REV9]CAE6944272.1 Peptidase M60-like family [Vibrio sp. B1REV9]